MKTVLFDLDGTLLPLNYDEFLHEYITAISSYFASLADPRFFARTLLKSTEIMIRNDGKSSNQEVFMKDFVPAIGVKEEILYPRLEKFYTEEFPKLKRCTRTTSLSGQILEELLARGWQIVLATNALFPLNAIEERMRWAGIDRYPWNYITTYENSRACKPNPQYYREIMDKLGLEPGECWMVGNDTQEDLVAAVLGIKTYLVTDFLIERGEYPEPTVRGSLQQLLQYIKEYF